MLSRKKYHNTSISPGTAGKYVRKDSLSPDEGAAPSTSTSNDPEIKAPFDISQLPILNPGKIQPQYGFRRDGRERHPVKRAGFQSPGPKVAATTGQSKGSPSSVSPTVQQSPDPFLKVSPYTAPVAMISTQIPSHITMGVAQPVQIVHSGQKNPSHINAAAPSVPAATADGSGSAFGVYPANFGTHCIEGDMCLVSGEPLVPPNPMVHAEIPEWISVYVKAHPRHDDKLKWNMFSLSKLNDFDLMVKWQMKREIEEIVLAYERYRTAIIQELHRRKIDASRYNMPP